MQGRVIFLEVSRGGWALETKRGPPEFFTRTILRGSIFCSRERCNCKSGQIYEVRLDYLTGSPKWEIERVDSEGNALQSVLASRFLPSSPPYLGEVEVGAGRSRVLGRGRRSL